MHNPLYWVVEGAAEKTGSPVADLAYLTEVARLGAGEGGVTSQNPLGMWFSELLGGRLE